MALTTGAAAEERAVSKQVTVKAPVEAVWNAWTTTEGVKSFFAPDARIEARPDGAFEVYMNPYAQPGMKRADDMRVLAVQERFVSGPIDWTDWLARMKAYSEKK